MRNLILILAYIFFGSDIAIAQNYWVSETNSKVYKTKQLCEAENQLCVMNDGKDLRYYDIKTVEVDDPLKPIFKPRYNVKTCDDIADCQSKIAEAPPTACNANDFFKIEENAILPGYSYFCLGIASYEKKNEKQLVLNADKKALIDSQDAEKLQETAALANRLKDVTFGAVLVSTVANLIQGKNLTTTQKLQFINDNKDVMNLWQVGAIADSKPLIESIATDGTTFTTQDKAKILELMNRHLPN